MTSRLDAPMRTALRSVAAFGALFALAAAVLSGGRAALAVAIGAAIAASNLYFLARIVGALVGGGDPARAADDDAVAPRSSAAAWGLLALVKMVFLFGGMWLLMTRGLVDPIPLLIGYGSLPIGIAIGSLVSDKTARLNPR